MRLPDYSHGTLAHAGNRLLTVIAGQRLACYREDGTPAWSRRVDAAMSGTLPTARGCVYVDATPILRVDIETGRVLAWRDVEPEYPDISLNEDEDLLLFSAETPLAPVRARSRDARDAVRGARQRRTFINIAE